MTIDKNIQKQIISFLKWDEGKYAQFVYDCGIEYLENFIPDYPQVVTEISKSRIFWNWWEKHWETRDMEWLESIEGLYRSHEWFEEVYKNLHDAKTLAAAIYLNGRVLEESYVNMINEITGEQKVVRERPSSFRGHFAMHGKGGNG